MIHPNRISNLCWRITQSSPLVANIINSRQLLVDAILYCRFKPETQQPRQVVRYEGSGKGGVTEKEILQFRFEAARSEVLSSMLYIRVYDPCGLLWERHFHISKGTDPEGFNINALNSPKGTSEEKSAILNKRENL